MPSHGGVIVYWRLVVLVLEQLETRPAHRQVELAADCQDGVADRFRIQPGAVHAPQQPVVGVHLVAGSGLEREVCR